jgi:hypothetical protein
VEGVVDDERFSYEGVACAVAGVLGIIGVLNTWWQIGPFEFDGASDASGTWAFAMAIATFAFGVAYVVMSDAAIRKISSILMAVTATLMTAAAIAGIGRADQVRVDAEPGMGLWITLAAGVIGMVGGYLGVRASSRAAEPEEATVAA